MGAQSHRLKEFLMNINKNKFFNKETLYVIVLAFLFGMQSFQYYEYKETIGSFISKGPRFTADDGVKLCVRIKRLEEKVYRYQDSDSILTCEVKTP